MRMTNLAALPVYGFDILAGNNEDLSRSYAYVDDRVVDVVVYNGGSNIAPPGYAGSSPYTGNLPAYFAAPASGQGRPALGTASISGGVLQAVTPGDPGFGYAVTELVGLSIPGAGSDVVVEVQVGNQLALDGIVVDVEVRPSPGSKLVLLSASTQPTINGLPTSGTVSLYGNVMTIVFLESAMSGLAAGTYAFEARGYADGATKVIAKGKFIVSQGVAFERG